MGFSAKVQLLTDLEGRRILEPLLVFRLAVGVMLVAPSVGQAPRRRNDCAQAEPTHEAATTTAKQAHFIVNRQSSEVKSDNSTIRQPGTASPL